MLVIAAVFTVLGPGRSWADQIDLRQTANPRTVVIDGLDFSSSGLSPGMTYDAVKDQFDRISKASRAQWVETIPQSGAMFLNGTPNSASSKPYPVSLRLVEHLAGLNLRVWFANPTTGGTAVTIEEGMFFRAPSVKPSVDDFKRGLVERFGAPSSPSEASPLPDDVRTEKLIWNFDGAGRVLCDPGTCEIATAPNTLNTLPYLEKRLDRGLRVIVTASITTFPDDPVHVGAYNIIIEDLANEVLTLQEARKQLQAAIGKP